MPLPITLASPPSRASAPQDYVTNMDSWLGSDLPGMVSQINSLKANDLFPIVGTVSQSGGVPTGAIIEGPTANANGTFVRWANGTQICLISANLGSIVANGAGTFADAYRTTATNLDWPAAFAAGTTPFAVGVGRVPAASVSDADRLVSATIRNPDRTTARQCQVVRLSGATTVQDGWIDIIAIGDWF